MKYLKLLLVLALILSFAQCKWPWQKDDPQDPPAPPPPPPPTAQFSANFVDLVSGPNVGGDGNFGAYVTVFGTGFGASGTVTIGGAAVGQIMRWTDTEITLRPGAGISGGEIAINGTGTGLSFTVVDGDIYYVSLSGDQATGVIGDINYPFRSVQQTVDRADFGPGDQAVVRAGDWNDDGENQYSAFFALRKSGTVDAPMAVMAYPGEAINIVRTGGVQWTRGIHSWGGSAPPSHVTVAGFHINLNPDAFCDGLTGAGIGLQPGAVNVRVVNNEVEGMWNNGGGSAAITGSGKQFRILGNHVHDNAGSKLYHALYFDGRDTSGPDDIEIAYNHIYNQWGGRGIQIYGDTGALISNVKIHHNRIHDIALDGILLGRDTGAGAVVYQNRVYRTANDFFRGLTGDEGVVGAALRFDGADVAADVHNNTLADCAVDGAAESTCINFSRQAVSVSLRDNVVANALYARLTYTPTTFVSNGNDWWGAGAAPSWDVGGLSIDPVLDADYNITSTDQLLDGKGAR